MGRNFAVMPDTLRNYYMPVVLKKAFASFAARSLASCPSVKFMCELLEKRELLVLLRDIDYDLNSIGYEAFNSCSWVAGVALGLCFVAL